MPQVQRISRPTSPEDGRHVIGHFVAPGTEASAEQGFMVVDLSCDGMSILRVAPKPGEGRGGLDGRFCWLAVPLPERGAHVCALSEVVDRKRYGPLELIGVRFEQMDATDRAVLEAYLSERDRLSFGARRIRQ